MSPRPGAQEIAALLFDKDGTLLDFRRTWEGWGRDVLADLSGGDPALASALGAAMGFDPARGFAPESPVIAGTAAEVAARLAAVLPGLPPEEIITRLDTLAARITPVPPLPLEPLLSGLVARGLALGVMTNDTVAVARAHFGALAVTQHFERILGADSGFGAKPAPGPLLAFAEALNLPPHRVAMVGDSTHDLLAARAAGMRPVAVLTGIAGAETLAPLAEVVLPDIGALPQWLDAARG